MQMHNTGGLSRAFSKNLPIEVVLPVSGTIGAWASIRLVQ